MRIIPLLCLVLLLAGCKDRTPMPRITGEWQCREGISIAFPDKTHYEAQTPDGARKGTFKYQVGEGNAHAMTWQPEVEGEPAPLPGKFRYYETDHLARLFFYTQEGTDVACERLLKPAKNRKGESS